MRRRNNKSILIGFLCVTLILMGIGYSILSSTLNITGTAKSAETFDVHIESVANYRKWSFFCKIRLVEQLQCPEV